MYAWLHRAEAVCVLNETEQDGWRTAVGEFGASSGGGSNSIQWICGGAPATAVREHVGKCLTKA